MENIEYSGIKNEQESPFDVISTDNSFVDFSDYVDPRESSYSTVTDVWNWNFESTVVEEGWEYNNSTVTNNDDTFYDDLELQFWEKDNGYNYVKMKKWYQKWEEERKAEVWDVLKSTKWSSSNTVTITSLQDVLWKGGNEDLLGKKNNEYDLAA